MILSMNMNICNIMFAEPGTRLLLSLRVDFLQIYTDDSYYGCDFECSQSQTSRKCCKQYIKIKSFGLIQPISLFVGNNTYCRLNYDKN